MGGATVEGQRDLRGGALRLPAFRAELDAEIAGTELYLDRLLEIRRLLDELPTEASTNGASAPAPAAAEPAKPPRRSRAATKAAKKGNGNGKSAPRPRSEPRTSDCRLEVLGALRNRDVATSHELQEATGYAQSVVDRALHELEDGGQIEQAGKDGRARLWRLAGSSASPAERRRSLRAPGSRSSAAPQATEASDHTPHEPADVTLRSRIQEILAEGARLGPDLYAEVGEPADQLMGQVMRQLLEAKKIRRMPRAGHVYYELGPAADVPAPA